ncbi:MAG: leucine-rich repeat protein [Butyrivibrio sp.]|nr:leucine-rich repeat protein [Butyrivibrio sp.]
MSADFSTEINIKGSKKDCIKFLEWMKLFIDEKKSNYQSQNDGWYLEGELPEELQDALKKEGKNYSISIAFEGPYGFWNGPIKAEIDLFERIADLVPDIWLDGKIYGWDSGAKQSIEVLMENGLLYMKNKYDSLGENEDENEDDGQAWDTIYNPKTKSYQPVNSDKMYEQWLGDDVINVLNSIKSYNDERNHWDDLKKIISSLIKKIPEDILKIELIKDGFRLKEYDNTDEVISHLLFISTRGFTGSGTYYDYFSKFWGKIYEKMNSNYLENDIEGTDIKWRTKAINEGEVKIVSCKIQSSKEKIEITVPEMIGENKVVDIGEDVFSVHRKGISDYDVLMLSRIEKITYPNSIKKLCIAGNECAKKIVLNKGIQSLQRVGIATEIIELPESISTLGYGIFDSCNYLKEVIIPRKVKKIPERAFYWSGIKKVRIPDSVVEIGENAFSGCKELKEIYIPKSVKKISPMLFREGTNIKSIIVDSENEVFDSRDGCNAIIYTSENIIICGCANTTLPSSVKGALFEDGIDNGIDKKILKDVEVIPYREWKKLKKHIIMI